MSADDSEGSISKGKTRGAKPDIVGDIEKLAAQLQIESLVVTEVIVFEDA